MFKTHKLNERGFKEVASIKATMSDAAEKVVSFLPDSRDKSIFITKLEEAMFFATRGVASKPFNHDEIISYSAVGEKRVKK